MSKRRVAFFAVATLCFGCATASFNQRVEQVKPKAPQDLSCGADQITYSDSAGFVVASGCGEMSRYFVACNAMPVCFEPQGSVPISRMVKRQAAFDLKCDEKSLTLTTLAQDTWGVSGCERQASYVLVPSGCSTEASCRLVQNSQTQ